MRSGYPGIAFETIGVPKDLASAERLAAARERVHALEPAAVQREVDHEPGEEADDHADDQRRARAAAGRGDHVGQELRRLRQHRDDERQRQDALEDRAIHREAAVEDLADRLRRLRVKVHVVFPRFVVW